MDDDQRLRNLVDPGSLAPSVPWTIEDWLVAVGMTRKEFARKGMGLTQWVMQPLTTKSRSIKRLRRIHRALALAAEACSTPDYRVTAPTIPQVRAAFDESVRRLAVMRRRRTRSTVPTRWTFADWLTALGLSMADICTKSGLSKARISTYASGARAPTTSTLAILHQALAARAYETGMTGPTVPQLRASFQALVGLEASAPADSPASHGR